jgi:pimeloyl-ACP methyl ester carboxylesterase
MKNITATVFACLILSIGGAGFAAPGDSMYTRPGRLVAAGDGARLNLYCIGRGSPAVVFDSGWEDWAPAWAVVQPRVATWTRACTYDRAGAGFSDPGPMPRTSMRIADELRTALHNAGVLGPYILVGHAFGGDNVRAFADRYMAEVAGMVLVEADPVDGAPKAMQDEDHRNERSYVVQLRACGDLVAKHKPLPLAGRPPASCAQQFFRGLPEVAWSAELNNSLLQIARTKASMYDAFVSEMQQMATDEAYLQQHRRSFGARPIRVLTTGNHAVGTLNPRRRVTAAHVEYERQIRLAQARWLTLSSNARQIFPQQSSEYVQFDAPEAVVSAIREVYDQRIKAVKR